MQIKNFLSFKDAVLILIPVLGLGLINFLAPCTFTFCKSGSAPQWIESLYFYRGAPFFQGIFIAIIMMFPMIALCDRQTSGIIACLVSAVTISLAKHLPDFDPAYDYTNLAIDSLWALAGVTPGFFIAYVLVYFLKGKYAR